jgi:ABC-type phosphate transport system substrate-binding protein
MGSARGHLPAFPWLRVPLGGAGDARVRRTMKAPIPLLLAVALFLGCRTAPGLQRASGNVRYVGSSTVGLFVREAAEVYGAVHFELDTGPESEGGERAIVSGEADLAGSAGTPRQATLDAGVVATLIGRDGIAVIVNARNPVRNLSREMLRGIFTGKVANWREVGGPDLPIEPYVVGPGSATRRVFADAILRGSDYEGCTQAVPDGSILDSVASSAGAIGHISFSFLGKRQDVRPLAVDGQRPSVTNFDYPISRPLYLLWREGDPVVEGFVAWSRSAEGQSVVMRHFAGTRVRGSVRSNKEPDPTGTLIVYTPTYRFYDGGVDYYPHRPYEILDRSGLLLRRVINHSGENDETPVRVELAPGTYLIRTRTARGGPSEFYVTIDAGRLTELDVVALLDPQGRGPSPARRTPARAAWPGPFEQLKFYGDLRLREEASFDLVGRDDDARTRLRLRLGVNHRINDELLVGVRLATGDPDDPNSTHVTFGDGFDKLEVNLDRAFLSYRPLWADGAWGRMGKFNHAFKRNPVYGELVWDADVQPEGVLLGRSWRNADFGERFALVMGGYSVQHSSDSKDVYALVGQVSGKAEISNDVAGRLSLAGYHYTDVNPSGSTDLIDDNRGNAAAGGEYVSQFGIINPILALEWEGLSGPLVTSAEYVRNLRAEIDNDEGWALGIAYGSRARRGDWRAYYQWQVVERDALFSPFAQDDFLQRVNFRGHAAGVSYMFTDKIALHLWALVSSIDDVDPTVPSEADDQDQWRLRLDLDVKL